jgi:hypothetical protein
VVERKESSTRCNAELYADGHHRQGLLAQILNAHSTDTHTHTHTHTHTEQGRKLVRIKMSAVSLVSHRVSTDVGGSRETLSQGQAV